MKFKIGDYVVGNNYSRTYGITSISNDFVGRVISQTPSGKAIEVETVSICKELLDEISTCFTVNSSHFDLAPMDLLLSLGILHSEEFEKSQDELFLKMF